MEFLMNKRIYLSVITFFICLQSFSVESVIDLSLDSNENISCAHVVSFIIPCFNCETTVEESIKSIYQQNLKVPFEVICTNDGSSDNTKSVLELCEGKYPNFFVYSHENNRGGAVARNTCVLHARGDLIFCLDSDNILCENSVNGLINLIDEIRCDIAVFNEVKFFNGNYNNTNTWVYSTSATVLDINSFIAPENGCTPVFSGNYLFTRKSYDRVGGYLDGYGALDTTAFGLAQLATGSKMALLKNHFYWHRTSDNSYWRRQETRNNYNSIKLFKHFSELFSEETNYFFKSANKSTQCVWDKWSKHEFKLTSPLILESLFRAYSYREKKQYLLAAKEFYTAISYGCNSLKIHNYFRQMNLLAKSNNS